MITSIHPVDLDNYVERDLIRTQTHPTHPQLVILNYTREAQYERKWTDLTLSARGLVIDSDTNEVVARPFSKFFNLSEPECIKVDPDEPYTLWEKMDGWLGILFCYKGEWIWATRGSFTTEQSKWAAQHFEENYSYDTLDPEFTHVFEIINPKTRIVINYNGEERLVSLGSIHTETGVEIGPNSTFPTPRKYDLTLEEMLDYEEDNFEGFVIKTQNGRAKHKLVDYVYLYRVVSGITTVAIWEALMEGRYEEYVAEVPEEFLPWVTKVSSKLQVRFHEAMAEANADYLAFTVEGDRKETARKFENFGGKPTSARFAILDGDDASEIIWKHIRPEHETFQ